MNLCITIDHREDLLERLRKIEGVRVDCCEAEHIPDELAAETEMLFCELPPDNLVAMKALKFIQISSTGYSQLFDLGLNERGIIACNGRGEFDAPIAEWAIAMMVNLNRSLRDMVRNQEAGIWERPAKFQTEIRGKTLGLFGYGSLARETARLAKNMGMKIHAFDRERTDFTKKDYYIMEGTGDSRCLLPDAFFFPGEEEAFFSGLDFLAVAMPLTNNTKGIVTERYLRALPQGAFLLNFARGPLIDEAGLLSVLRDGHLGGAALDAHYHYPMPADHPLWRFPNVILTPHISGSTLSPHFLDRIYEICIQNVERYMDGRPPLNRLTPFQLDGN